MMTREVRAMRHRVWAWLALAAAWIALGASEAGALPTLPNGLGWVVDLVLLSVTVPVILLR